MKKLFLLIAAVIVASSISAANSPVYTMMDSDAVRIAQSRHRAKTTVSHPPDIRMIEAWVVGIALLCAVGWLCRRPQGN